jgi:hypothetical protein
MDVRSCSIHTAGQFQAPKPPEGSPRSRRRPFAAVRVPRCASAPRFLISRNQKNVKRKRCPTLATDGEMREDRANQLVQTLGALLQFFDAKRAETTTERLLLSRGGPSTLHRQIYAIDKTNFDPYEPACALTCTVKHFLVCLPSRFRRATAATSWARLGARAAIRTCATVVTHRRTSEAAVSP